MSNIIYSGDKDLQMSNGLTDVFINVLVLSGSRIAVSDSEKRFVVWLAERDQSKVGGGTVGFEISEMPWNSDDFSECKAFLLNAVKFAEQRLGWEALDYPPNENMLFPALRKFAELITDFSAKYINPVGYDEWFAASSGEYDPMQKGYPKCEKHGVLLSCYGCQVCNN